MTRATGEEQVIRERIGAVIEARRIARGLGAEELARAADVDLSQLIRVVKGRSGFSLYALSRIARALGWSLGELVYVAFPPGGKARRRFGRIVRRDRRSSSRDLTQNS